MISTSSQAARTAPARQRTPWARRAGLALLALILALATAGALYQAGASAADRRAFPAPGQLVDVGGFKMHILCSGSATGAPTVILDTLSGGSMLSWAWVQPEVARGARVCSFDRAGYGWSEPDPQPESAARAARNLHALLASAGVPGPYVLVGHSKGGIYARAYAAAYPAEVAGMALIDASTPTQFERHPEWLAQERSFGRMAALFPLMARLGLFHLFFARGGEIDFAELPRPAHDALAAFWSSPEFWQRQRASIAAGPRIFAEARGLGGLGDMPLMVVSAASGGQPGWAELQNELAALSRNSAHRLVPGATHASLVFNPAHARQVAAAILDLVAAVRAHAQVRG